MTDHEQIPESNKDSKDVITTKKVGTRLISKEPYVEVCVFNDTDNPTLFTKRNYKSAISLSLTASRRRSAICVYDTGAGTILKREQLVKTDQLPSIRFYDNPWLKSVISKMVEVIGTILVHVRMWKTVLLAISWIVRISAAPVLLGMSFIDKLINGIFVNERKIVLFSSTPLKVLSMHEAEVYKIGGKRRNYKQRIGWGRCWTKSGVYGPRRIFQALIRNKRSSRNRYKKHCTSRCLEDI